MEMTDSDKDSLAYYNTKLITTAESFTMQTQRTSSLKPFLVLDLEEK
jgi:hypothetical protein